MKRRATVPEEKPKRISRREKLTHHLLELDIEVREKEKPFRTIVTTRIRRFEWGILRDSLAYGVFMDDTMVISSPGQVCRGCRRTGSWATLLTNVSSEWLSWGGGGTNDLVDRDRKTKAVEKIIPLMEYLARRYLEAGIQVTITQIPPQRGFQRRDSEFE